ncbi:MAG: hypothetical protein AAB281_07270 [Actinomycetota bacterium]
MFIKANKVLSLLILLLGVALVIRSVLAAGGMAFTAGMVAGAAFTIYGAVRLYYYKESP